ncbi:hypothetical protein [uncultured Flavobacterium sp.]|uniref:hypothetical protein n=1 Tax=uncultured Flavobacterium sp. TaxID=165435 RepID=UPI00292EBF3D|nr:hypothetical protein [uncultured Flavobacterium sp.]
MKYLKILVLCPWMMMVSCATVSHLNLGSKVQTQNSSDKILIPSGALVPEKKVSIKNIKYSLGISNNEVIYVSTSDKAFQIDDSRIGNIIGMKVMNAKLIPGWGYYVKLENDWYAGINFKEKITANSKIEWFFKYKFNESTNVFK